jgi:DNA polymerase-4
MYFSSLAKKIYLSYTDLVEPFGADECWLDVTGSQLIFGNGEVMQTRYANG